LALQKIAYRSEAVLLGNDAIPPLIQTLEELSDEYEEGLILKAVLDGIIIGSVRAFSDGRTCYIGKLMVSPEHQRKGYGSRLLAAIENLWPHRRFELFTSDKSAGNIRLYEKSGYSFFRKRQMSPHLKFVYLEKNVPMPGTVSQ